MTPDPALVIDAPVEPTLRDVEAGTRTQVVLDTSALVADPEGVLAGYPGCDLVVPLTVIEELDGLKKRLDPVGMSARDVLRRIERIRIDAGGDLETPQPLPGDATLRVALNGVQVSLLREHGLDPDKPDNRIIGTALGQRFDAGRPVRLVSNDTGMRVKAATFGLDSCEHDPLDSARQGDGNNGWRELDVDPSVVDAVYAGELDDPDLDDAAGRRTQPWARIRSEPMLVRTPRRPMAVAAAAPQTRRRRYRRAAKTRTARTPRITASFMSSTPSMPPIR